MSSLSVFRWITTCVRRLIRSRRRRRPGGVARGRPPLLPPPPLPLSDDNPAVHCFFLSTQVEPHGSNEEKSNVAENAADSSSKSHTAENSANGAGPKGTGG